MKGPLESACQALRQLQEAGWIKGFSAVQGRQLVEVETLDGGLRHLRPTASGRSRTRQRIRARVADGRLPPDTEVAYLREGLSPWAMRRRVLQLLYGEGFSQAWEQQPPLERVAVLQVCRDLQQRGLLLLIDEPEGTLLAKENLGPQPFDFSQFRQGMPVWEVERGILRTAYAQYFYEAWALRVLRDMEDRRLVWSVCATASHGRTDRVTKTDLVFSIESGSQVRLQVKGPSSMPPARRVARLYAEGKIPPGVQTLKVFLNPSPFSTEARLLRLARTGERNLPSKRARRWELVLHGLELLLQERWIVGYHLAGGRDVNDLIILLPDGREVPWRAQLRVWGNTNGAAEEIGSAIFSAP